MKKLLTLVSLATLMFSCSKNNDLIPDIEKLPIKISIGQQTRANDDTYENGDKVGIYVVNYDGATAGALTTSNNQVNNKQFTYDGSKWTPEESIYWKDGNTAADFYAYYPYSSSPNISAHPFSVQKDQSNEDNFWASDFLWGKAIKISPTPNAVSIQTNHSLSRIIVDIKPGEGFTAESWAAATKSVKICDIKTSATINLSTGVATETGSKGEIIPLATAETGTTLSYKAMMIPQVVTENSKLVVVTIDDTDYIFRKEYTFSSNTIHKFTVIINKSGSNVDVTIGEWKIDNTVNEGIAEEDPYPFNENHCIYYRANQTGGWDSGYENYRATSSYITCGAGGTTLEMKFKLKEFGNYVYLAAGGNLARESCDELKISNSQITLDLKGKDDEGDWYSSYYSTWNLADFGVSATDLITMRLSGETITINGKTLPCKNIPYLSWSYIFSNYYREYDEGEWKEYEGVSEGSELYYVKMFDTEGNNTYFGYAKCDYNPTTGKKEYYWHSNTQSPQYANDYLNQGGYTGNF